MLECIAALQPTLIQMQSRLTRLAGRFWPALDEMPASRQVQGVGEVILFLIFTPVAVLGVIWLGSLTDPETIRSNLLLLIFIGAFAAILNRFSYYFVTST